MPTSFKNTGYKPAFHIGRPTIAAAAPSGAREYIAEINTIPVLDQAQTPACVSHAVAFAKMQFDHVNKGSFAKLSPRFLHALSKRATQPAGDGRYIDDVLQAAMTFGICEEEYFPNDTSLPIEEYEDINLIPPAAYQNAILHKIGAPKYLTDTSITGILTSIEQTKGVAIIGMEISPRWYTDADGNVTWDPTKLLPLFPGTNGEGHCVCIYTANLDTNTLGIQNSWGKGWANAGTGFFAPADLSYVYEAVIITS